MADFGKQLDRELDEIRDAGLWRELREIESAQSARIKFGGREFINFSSNDYLGLAAHSALGRAVREAVEQLGVGSGASRLICGSMHPLTSFERTMSVRQFNVHVHRPTIQHWSCARLVSRIMWQMWVLTKVCC